MSAVFALILLALVLVFVLFVIWDRRRPAKVVSREQMRRGFIPGFGTTWEVKLVLGLVALLMAYQEVVSPSAPPFTGRGSVVQSLAYSVFGSNGMAYIFSLFGALCLWAAYFSFRAGRPRP